MAMTKQETMDYIEELKQELEDRPVKIETVVEVHEVTISNSDMGGDIGKLAEALADAQGQFESVVKGSSAHAYDYADIKAVLEATAPITSKLGLAIVQMNVSKIMGKTVFVGVKTILTHSAGGWISSEVYVPATKTKMNTVVQVAGGNITYLRRYGIQSALGLSTTDDDGAE